MKEVLPRHFPTASPTALPSAPTAAAAAKYLQPLPSAPPLVTPTALHFILQDSYSSDDTSSSSSRYSIQKQQQQLVVAESTATPPRAAESPAVAANEVYGAVADAMHLPWTVKLLGLAVVNIVLLRLVLQLIRRFQESSAPCTLVKLQFGLRCSDSKMQEELRKLGEMIQLGQQGSWLILEEFALMLTQSRQSLVYADAKSLLTSVADGYEEFKRAAFEEAAAASREEMENVVHGEKPEAPQHRGPIGRLLGAPPTEDVDERQQVLLLTLVLAARGVMDIPTIKDWASARHALQQVCGLSSSKIMGVELLWTPEDPEDFLSEAQLMADYPNLVELRSGRKIRELVMASVDEPEWGWTQQVDGTKVVR